MAIYYPTLTNAVQKTLDAALLTGVTASATFNNVTGIQNKLGLFVVDRVDGNNNLTPNKREYISFAGTSGSTVTTLVRGLAGSTDQDHSVGAIVEFVNDVVQQQAILESLLAVVTTAGVLDTTKVVDIASTQTITGDKTFTGTITGAGAAFWTAFTGTYASAVTFTVATNLTAIFKKGVSLKWLSSADALKVGKVVSSSYGAPNTTVTVVGSAVEAGDKTFKYGADCMSETFIVAGNQSTGTNVSKTWTAKTDIYPISVDAVVSTAGTTNSTDYDVNDDGTTIIATKPAIASTATTDLDNVTSAPTTAIAVNSLVTVDIDAASTTQAIDGYITLFYIPQWWISRT